MAAAGAKRHCAWVVALWVMTMAVFGDGAHHHHVGAPAPAMDCTSSLLTLADCATFVEEGSKLAKPQGTCCSGLKKVVKEDVACLCQAFGSAADLGVALNMTKALALPAACGVSTPPISNCKEGIAGVPGAAPAPSPALGSPASVSGSASAVPAPSPGLAGAATTLPIPGFSFLCIMAVVLSSHYFL